MRHFFYHGCKGELLMARETQGSSIGAFSLIELSIVLVILGLLTGGILTGQSLIHAAALRSTLTQVTDLRQATYMFRDKYLGLPGDLPNAMNFWPTGTTNGDGNGIIDATGCTNGEADCGLFAGERAQYFRQLGLAGLGPSYDGTAVLGTGYPTIKLYPSKGMFMSGAFTSTSGSNMNIHLYATDTFYLYMGVCAPSYFGTSSQANDCAIFQPEESWNMDTKLDDGLPLSGKVLGHSYNTTCVSGSAYSLTTSQAACNMMINFR